MSATPSRPGRVPEGEPFATDAFDWPDFGLRDDVRPALFAGLQAGRACALATLFAVEGGAPRGVGAQMLWDDGSLTGFLSGGCVEADVARHAAAVAADGTPRRLVYGEGGPADVRLPCGSRIEVLVERVTPDQPAAHALRRLTDARRPALWLSDGQVSACLGPDDPCAGLPEALTRAAAAGNATCGATQAPFALFRAYRPALRLVVVGADPIALAVLRFAAEMGIETILIRPKGPAIGPTAPVTRYLRGSVEESLALVAPDPWTAIAVLSHDAEAEHDALLAALGTQAGYVGALGSRRRIPEREARLRAAGIDTADMARIHAPIGMAIGGKSPWEIAVAIIAEIVAETSGGAADERP
jgi:xanthine dehydrogenase accessory factor